MAQDYPGFRASFEGEQREQADAVAAIKRGFIIALFVIFALLAIPFRSYTQPLIIMAAIPFGIIGAILGHLVMGLAVGILSLFGIVGLAGVVVNDSLVLIDYVNREREKGRSVHDAVIVAAKVRFRPILLTSLTTFLGVLPLILERSLQAQFLIPIAASLGFGILFATFIILVLVPALVILEDRVRFHVLRFLGKDTSRFEYEANTGTHEAAVSTGSSLGSEPVAT
jgi:multidrug efflux pump subunit AcrB